jgi:hypothetical protein
VTGFRGDDMTILAKLFMWLTTGAGGGLLTKWLDVIMKRADTNAVGVSAAIQGEIAARTGARDVRLATAGFWEMRVLTGVIGFWFVLHLSLVAFDTITTGTRFEIVGWNVPAFPEPFNEWEGAIILSFFGLYGASKAVNSILAAVILYIRGK